MTTLAEIMDYAQEATISAVANGFRCEFRLGYRAYFTVCAAWWGCTGEMRNKDLLFGLPMILDLEMDPDGVLCCAV